MSFVVVFVGEICAAPSLIVYCRHYYYLMGKEVWWCFLVFVFEIKD